MDFEEKALRREYTRLRDIFQKRVKRGAEQGLKTSQLYLKGQYGYIPTLKEREQLPYLRGQGAEVMKRDLQFRLQELKRLVGEGIGSISRSIKMTRERDEAVLTALSNAGYEHITKSTLKNFGRFMDAMREQYGKKIPNSEEMAEFFDSLKYNTKRKSTAFLVKLWEEYQNNGMEPDYGSQDLFST